MDAIQTRPKSISKQTYILVNILLALFLLGMTFVSEWPAFQHVNRAVGGLLVLLFGMTFFQYRVKIPPEVWLLIAFVTWSGVSGSVVSYDYNLYMTILRLMIQSWFLVLAVSGFLMLFDNVKIPMALVVGLGGILLISTMLTGEFTQAMDPNDHERLSGVVNNSNNLGFRMLWSVMALMFFWNVYKARWIRGLILGATVPFILAIIYSGSRKTFIVLILFFLLWLVLTQRRLATKRLGTFLIFLLIPFVLYFLSDYMFHNTYMGTRFQMAMDNPDVDNARSQMYKRGLDLFWEKPITGVGLGNFQVVSGIGTYSHSDYMEVASNTGIVGFILYFSIYAVLLWRLLWLVRQRLPDDEKYCVYMFINYIVVLLALAFGVPNMLSPFSWFLLSCMIGYSYRLSQRVERRYVLHRMKAMQQVHQS